MAMKKTVLIVEDNELNMKLFNDLLEAHGYATLKTSHGIEAMELARAHRPDLILMDIQLPEVSGLEVTRWLKADEELKSIPVIAITAFAMKGDEERIREGGCEAYMSKPISVAKFIATIKTYPEAGGQRARPGGGGSGGGAARPTCPSRSRWRSSSPPSRPTWKRTASGRESGACRSAHI